MKLSIVATLYESSPYLNEFYQRARAVASEFAGEDLEIVLVNDGSPDDSLDKAVRLTGGDPRLVVVDLSRNFGHHKAMMTGLAHALGDYVFLIDSDLEEDPEWLAPFWTQLTGDAVDVVYGVQAARKGGWFERWSGRLFYRMMPKLSGVSYPANMVTARLMTRRYVDALLRHEEREIDIGGLWEITGFAQAPHTVVKHSTSETTYTFRHRVAVAVNSITSFSNVPLVLIFYVGITLFILAGAYALYVLVTWYFLARPVNGWTSLILSIWLLGALIISFLGIVAVYLAKIFSEVKRRPYTIVREIYGRNAS